MSDFERIGNNSIYSFLSIFFRLFANVILFWLIARFYGKEIFGQFTIAQTFASVFVIFADFGLDFLLTNELPRKARNSIEIFRRLFSIKLLLLFFSFLAMFIISLIGDFSSQVRELIIIFSFYAGLTTISNFLYALFRGSENLKYETRVSFFVNLVTLIAVLTLIILKQDIIIISLTFVLMRFLGLILAIYFAYQVLPSLSFRLDFNGLKSTLNQVIFFGLFLVFGNLYFQLDTILLSLMKGEDKVGLYQSVFRLIMLPLILPEVFINSIMPALSRLHSNDVDKWQNLGKFLRKFLIIVAIPVSGVLFIFSSDIISLIYGKAEYGQAIPILKIFALIVFVRFFGETYGLMLTTSQRQKYRTIIVVIATLINLTLNVIFIPTYGINGAALVSLVTNIFVAGTFYIFTRSQLQNWGNDFINLRLIVIAVTTIATFFVFKAMDIWILFIITFISYFYFIYKYFLAESEKKYILDMKLLLSSRFST